MLDGITLITPTGDRHKLLARCLFYIQRQTVWPNQWIVVDDGLDSSKAIFDNTKLPVKYVRRTTNNNAMESFVNNLLNALSLVRYERVFFIEDDDWYAPTYLERSDTLFKVADAQIVGRCKSVYYHPVYQGYKQHQNLTHSSLCQTAIGQYLIPTFEIFLRQRSTFLVDLALWKHARANYLATKLVEDNDCIGMKGLPGRPGITAAHTRQHKYTFDPRFEFLKDLIGERDAQFYMEFKP